MDHDTVMKQVAEFREKLGALRRRAHKTGPLQKFLTETIDFLTAAFRDLEAADSQQERLRSLAQLASSVAHDLNNTLSPILGFAESFDRDPDLPSVMRGPMRLILTGAREAAAVVDRLQDFYRPAATLKTNQLINLTQLVEQIPEITRPKWRDEALRTGRKIEIEIQTTGTPAVAGNPSELRDVLIQLVFNAVDAMSSSGRIAIRLSTSGKFAAFEVEDSGTGMSAETRKRCFEPFFTTKESTSLGLGLSYCHEVVERHGGQIDVHSAPGKGCLFRIYLPLASPETATSEARTPSAELAHRHVLFVDDDPRVRSVVTYLLRQLGQQVDVCDSGAAALERLQTQTYDVVITDLGMPELDGHEVTRCIKKERQGIPVILLTGWASPFVSTHLGVNEQPDFVLRKPATLEKLAEALSNVFRGHSD